MKLKLRGDTLIEVLFAFAILSLVVSTAFSGSLSAYKSSLAAQNQTQANFVAQYQAEALKTYRDALEWNDSNYPNFLAGYSKEGSNSLPALNGYFNNPGNTFCMFLENPNFGKATADMVYWRVEENDVKCNNTLRTLLAPELGNNSKLEITLEPDDVSNPKQVTATVKVTWTPRNSKVEQSVVNKVLLTK
jgi:type II secretory pathway pseudopilin PulG